MYIRRRIKWRDFLFEQWNSVKWIIFFSYCLASVNLFFHSNVPIVSIDFVNGGMCWTNAFGTHIASFAWSLTHSFARSHRQYAHNIRYIYYGNLLHSFNWIHCSAEKFIAHLMLMHANKWWIRLTFAHRTIFPWISFSKNS